MMARFGWWRGGERAHTPVRGFRAVEVVWFAVEEGELSGTQANNHDNIRSYIPGIKASQTPVVV